MKSLFDEDIQEESRGDADLTLGIGSLLGIFFGVVLICGIFFGFGYSMGRRNAHATANPAATTLPPAVASAPLPDNDLNGAPLKPDNASPSGSANPAPDASKAQPAAPSSAKKDQAENPKPAKADAEPATPPPAQAQAPAQTKTTRVVDSATANPSLNAVPFSHRATLPTKPHAGISAPLDQAPVDSPIIPGHPIMVQIAAVSRQEDAEVLAGALRKRGFNPTVHPGTGDKLFHVQVGPFTDKTQAETMKQHLLADGYNAIMK